jgi:hypothetical protein
VKKPSSRWICTSGVGGRNGGSIPGASSPQVIELSETLKRLGAYPAELQGEKYRNPNGFYLKLMNLRSVETEGAHGMAAGSKTDAAVWRDFADNLPALHAEAETICERLQEGVIQPAQAEATAEDVDIEQQHTETFVVNPSGEQRPAERASLTS